MVISDEIKFPRPIRIDPYRHEKKVEPVDATVSVAKIGAFRREWQRSREERRSQAESLLPPSKTEYLRHLVSQVNAHLEARHIPIHLVLSKKEAGYIIDVYDCTGDERCVVIGDVLIDLNDLQILLKNLQQESGILFDTVS